MLTYQADMFGSQRRNTPRQIVGIPSGNRQMAALTPRAIALMATPGEVGWSIPSTMLLCDDMFDVEGKQRIIVLVHPAILTAIAGPAPDQSANGGAHGAFFVSNSRVFACMIAMKSANAR